MAFSAALLDSLQGHAVAAQIKAAIAGRAKDVENVADQRVVEVLAAEKCIASRGQDLEHASGHLDDRDVEGAAAEVVDRDATGVLGGLAIGQSAAAVGSLMMRRTSRPAMRPASLVAWRWASSKYAGTVITASATDSPRKSSAVRRILSSTMAETSGGE